MCSFVDVELEGSQGPKVILVFLATITVVADDMLIITRSVAQSCVHPF